MKVRALGLVYLISGALAVPILEEQTQRSQQVPQQAEPEPPAPLFRPEFPDEPEMDPERAMMVMGHGQMRRAVNILSGHVDINAFQQVVNQVQEQVQQIEQLIHEKGPDSDTLMQALVEPMSRLNQTLAVGVSRLALPIPDLDLGGVVGGVVGSVNQPAPLLVLTELLRAVSNLLENLLSGNPVADLLNDILGDVLGGIGGAVGDVLGDDYAAQIQALIDSILGSIASLLPGACGAVPIPLSSIPVPSIPIPSVPIPGVSVPSVPVPSIPIPSIPVPFVSVAPVETTA
ncbi:hypothetical protein C8A03DRAFT_13941 [Achaetomium macrosporum]|uniref:Uncharacterized protein n=1 Tax=Achaetomium macrosporum TaxID=79813 RepID=A0AAN7HCG3_9PEZI|nr:hypothetical protein C8A03DRAFT_13941 [Achaetomium macrosporum]